MSPPLATVATEFLERQGLAKSTVQSYELTLLPLLAEYGSYPIEILSRSTLIAYLDGLSHLAYTTHQRHQAIIQALFNFGVERGYLKANPIARLQRRKPNRDLRTIFANLIRSCSYGCQPSLELLDKFWSVNSYPHLLRVI